MPPSRCLLHVLSQSIDFSYLLLHLYDNIYSLGNQAMMVSKVLLQRRLFRFLQLSSPSLCSFSSSFSISGSPFHSVEATEIVGHSTSFRSFCSQKSNLVVESHGPAPIDYRCATAHPLMSL